MTLDDLRVGRAEALDALYRAHAAGLLRLALRFTGSQSDAEDIVHDLFVGLPEMLRRYEGEAFLPFLRGVVVRLALRQRRRESRREGLLGAMAAANEPTLSDPLAAIDTERALAKLPEPLRDVLICRLIEGLSHAETASLLGISVTASRVRSLRAIRQLRLLLDTNR
jgi:RNA polymerase sigma-70 factor (ECF subfamily)